MFFFSQKNTDEQNTQHSKETLSQPISQSVTANVSWKASVNSVCRRRSVCSKRAQKGSVNSVRSVREKTPQRVTCVSSHREGVFYFSQKNTDEQNTQHSTETLSQPITQSVTANVSWKASVNSVCRRPSVGSKLGAKRLSELCALCERKNYPASLKMFFLSQKNTEELNTQHSKQVVAPPPWGCVKIDTSSFLFFLYLVYDIIRYLLQLCC